MGYKAGERECVKKFLDPKIYRKKIHRQKIYRKMIARTRQAFWASLA